MKPSNRRDAISMDCSFLRAMSRCAFAPPCEIITEILGLSVPFKLRLVEAMEIPRGGTVLDVGTGTGLVPILLLQGRPDLTVVGLDADPAILERAQQNAVRAGIFPIFEQGCAHPLVGLGVPGEALSRVRPFGRRAGKGTRVGDVGTSAMNWS